MEGDNGDDPYASLIGLCQISVSQEDLLKLCPFAGKTDMEDDSEPSDSSELGVDSSGIVIVSLPESWEPNDSSPGDEYHTPPEGSALASSDGQRSAGAVDDLLNDDRVDDETFNTETALCDGRWMDGAKVVDLGRDTDVGFSSEVQLSQKSDESNSEDRPVALEQSIFEKEIGDLEPKKFGVSGKEFCFGEALAELSRNELKVIEQVVGLELPTFSTETTTEKASEVVMKVFNELKNVGVTSPDQTLEINEEMLVATNCAGEITEVKSSGKKKFNFSGELESNSLTETEIIGSVDLNESITYMEFNKTLEVDFNESTTYMEFNKTLEVDLEMEEADLERVENGVKDNKGCNYNEYDMEYTDKCIVENTETNGGAGMSKLLPPLVNGVRRKASDVLDSDASPLEAYRDVTILDVLKILKGEEDCKSDDDGDDDDLADLSILDILKRRGMTFPRPSWWPEGGFCCSRSRFL